MPKKRTNVPIPEGACSFCRSTEVNPILGDLIEKQNIKFHLNCVFAASGLSQEKDDCRTDDQYVSGFHIEAILKEIRRGRLLACTFCRIPGACVGCSVSSCPCSFHLPCLTKAGGMTIFEGLFPSYCRKHTHKQNVEKWLKLCDSEAPTCCICLFPIICDADLSAKLAFPVDKTPQTQQTSTPQTPKTVTSQMSTPQTAQTSWPSNRRLTRRSSLAASTPKRIRVSMCCEVKTVSPCSSNNSWEISSDPINDESESQEATNGIDSTLIPSSSWLEPIESSLSHLPNWLTHYLSNSPTDRQPAVYSSWLHDTIHGFCCPKAWMHRSCIAGYAVSAALHYLKCPYCADKSVFIPTVIAAGIWVPDRDAAWELEPGAFADLDPAMSDSSQHSNTTTNSDSSLRNVIPTTTSIRGTTTRRSIRSSVRAPVPTPRRPLLNATNIRPVSETIADSPQKAVFSLVWNNQRFSPPRGANNRSRPRRLTTLPKSPESNARRGLPQRRHLSLFPRQNTLVDTPENHRLRQATLSPFLANVRVSSRN